MRLKLRLLFLCALAAATMFSFAACGGGGGGGNAGGGPPPTATPTPTSYATIPPAGSTATQVLTLALGSGATAMGYDPTDNLVLLGVGSNVINAQDSHFLVLAPDGGIVTAVGYSTNAGEVVFATSTDVYETTISGMITKLAGGFSLIEALTVAPNGSIYVIDTDHVSTIGAGGTIVQITPSGTIGYNPNFNAPGLAYDSNSNTLIVADAANDVIDSITTGGTINVIAGSCKPFNGSCWRLAIPGSGANANFGTPNGVAYDPNTDTIYVADSANNDLWSVTPAGAATPVAGYGAPLNQDGFGLAAFLDQPVQLAYDAQTQSVDILQATASAQQAVAAYSTTGNAPPSFTFPALPAYVNASGISTAPDNSAWASDASGTVDHISTSESVTSFNTSTTVLPSLAVDAGGNAWASSSGGLLQVTPGGAQTLVAAQPMHSGAPNPPQMVDVSIAAGGNPWFTTSDTPPAGANNGGSFGYVTLGTNAVTQFALANVPGPISLAANGEVAFVQTNSTGTADTMSYANASGTILGTFAMNTPAQNSLVYDPVSGLNWYADTAGHFSSMSESGTENDYPACASGCNPIAVAAAPSGDIYGNEGLTPTVDRLTPTHATMLYPLPLGSGGTTGISARSDGKLWVSTNQGVTYLFDPAAYDAMGAPHPSAPLSLARRKGLSGVRVKPLRTIPWHRAR